MTNNSDSDPNFPFSPSNVVPRKKRTRYSYEETGASSSSRPKPVNKPDDPVDPPTCTVCGKQFRSLKALFGHMRCHPERDWRGINPPPPSPPKIQSETTTAATSSSPRVSVTIEEDTNIASYLLLLSSTTPSAKEQRFECGGCNKVFASLQALVSHRATHQHVKGCNGNFLTEDTPPQEQDKKSKSVTLVSGTNHPCNICFKVFSSGQALGGHMRRHWERDPKEKPDLNAIEKKDMTAIDLNVPSTSTAQNLPSSSSDTPSGCSLDLKLGL